MSLLEKFDSLKEVDQLKVRRLLHVDTFGVMTDRVVVPAALAVAKSLPAIIKNLLTHNLVDV